MVRYIFAGAAALMLLRLLRSYLQHRKRWMILARLGNQPDEEQSISRAVSVYRPTVRRWLSAWQKEGILMPSDRDGFYARAGWPTPYRELTDNGHQMLNVWWTEFINWTTCDLFRLALVMSLVWSLAYPPTAI